MRNDWEKAKEPEMTSEWANKHDFSKAQGYDFETNLVCQEQFKPFIEDCLNKLAETDRARVAAYETPENKIYYIFHEHAERAAGMVRDTAKELGLDNTVSNNLYWATLAHDIGKALVSVEDWRETEGPPPADVKARRRMHTNLGVQMVNERFADIDHPFKDLMLDMIENHHERLDGKGKLGLTADQISGPVRILQIKEDLDGGMTPRTHYITEGRDLSATAVMDRMRDKKYDWFDKELFDEIDKLIKNGQLDFPAQYTPEGKQGITVDQDALSNSEPG